MLSLYPATTPIKDEVAERSYLIGNADVLDVGDEDEEDDDGNEANHKKLGGKVNGKEERLAGPEAEAERKTQKTK